MRYHLTLVRMDATKGLQTINAGVGVEKREPSYCILSPCLFNFYAEYIMRNAGLEEAQAGIRIAGRKYP